MLFRSIVNQPTFQAVLVDTPGIHKPKTLLGHRLNAVVGESMDSVDIVLMCLPADETSGGGDVFLAQEIAKHPRAKKFALVTKTDLISKEKLALRLAGINDLAKGFTWDEIVPISAAITLSNQRLLTRVASFYLFCACISSRARTYAGFIWT